MAISICYRPRHPCLPRSRRVHQRQGNTRQSSSAREAYKLPIGTLRKLALYTRNLSSRARGARGESRKLSVQVLSIKAVLEGKSSSPKFLMSITNAKIFCMNAYLRDLPRTPPVAPVAAMRAAASASVSQVMLRSILVVSKCARVCFP
jgi:hypothetical protein